MKYIIKLLNYLLDSKDILFLQTVVSIAFKLFSFISLEVNAK